MVGNLNNALSQHWIHAVGHGNDLGQILGEYTDGSGATQAFLALPVAASPPEPASVGLLGVGVLGLVLLRRASCE